MRRSICGGLIVALAWPPAAPSSNPAANPRGAGAGTTRGMGRWDATTTSTTSRCRGPQLNKDKSILFNVGSFKAGLMVFSDNLEVESLINFSSTP